MEGNSCADQKRRSFRDRLIVAASFCPTESEKSNPPLLGCSRLSRNHLSISSNGPANCPELTARAHLQHNLIERPPRRAIHYVAYPGIVCSLMTGTLKTPTRGVVFH
jgi:hypothetical protein